MRYVNAENFTADGTEIIKGDWQVASVNSNIENRHNIARLFAYAPNLLDTLEELASYSGCLTGEDAQDMVVSAQEVIKKMKDHLWFEQQTNKKEN